MLTLPLTLHSPADEHLDYRTYKPEDKSANPSADIVVPPTPETAEGIIDLWAGAVASIPDKVAKVSVTTRQALHPRHCFVQLATDPTYLNHDAFVRDEGSTPSLLTIITHYYHKPNNCSSFSPLTSIVSSTALAFTPPTFGDQQSSQTRTSATPHCVSDSQLPVQPKIPTSSNPNSNMNGHEMESCQVGGKAQGASGEWLRRTQWHLT